MCRVAAVILSMSDLALCVRCLNALALNSDSDVRNKAAICS